MKKLGKALFISIIVIFTLSCNLYTFGMNRTGTDADSAGDESGSVMVAPNQDSSQNDSQSPNGSTTTNVDESDFATLIPTEVIVPDGVLIIKRFITILDPEISSCRTLILLENTSSDPLDIVKEFSYTMTWYDAQDQIVDQWDNTNGPNVFPQEKNLWEMWVDKEKRADRKISRAVFEIKSITTVMTYYQNSVRDNILNQPLNHPFFDIQAGDYVISQDFLLGTIATTPVTIKSNMANKVGVQVFAVYLNDQDVMTGFGKDGGTELDAGASNDTSVVGYNLTELPKKAEYYPILVGPSDLLEVVYPNIYK
jgi:hypothetical protein